MSVPTPPKVKNCSDIVKLFKDTENYHLSDLTSNFLRPKGLKVLVFARTRRHHSWFSAHLVHTLYVDKVCFFGVVRKSRYGYDAEL